MALDLSEVPDDYAVEVQPGLPVTLLLQGSPPIGAHLVCELMDSPSGKPIEMEFGRVRLPRSITDGATITSGFPCPGRYELVRYQLGDLGAADSSPSGTVVRTGEFFEVLDPEGPLPPGVTPAAARAANHSIVLRPGRPTPRADSQAIDSR